MLKLLNISLMSVVRQEVLPVLLINPANTLRQEKTAEGIPWERNKFFPSKKQDLSESRK